MKNLFMAENWEIIIEKELFSTLTYRSYLYTRFAIERAKNRSEALALLHDYVAIEKRIKTACLKNGMNYRQYATEYENMFSDLIETRFPLVDNLLKEDEIFISDE